MHWETELIDFLLKRVQTADISDVSDFSTIGSILIASKETSFRANGAEM